MMGNQNVNRAWQGKPSEVKLLAKMLRQGLADMVKAKLPEPQCSGVKLDTYGKVAGNPYRRSQKPSRCGLSGVQWRWPFLSEGNQAHERGT